jgi:hypothetical protein
MQVVNLPNLKIIDFSYGRTGSTHDSLAFKDTRMFREHETLFPDGEWIWADSAYTVASFPSRQFCGILIRCPDRSMIG